jgi:hypothetical protein
MRFLEIRLVENTKGDSFAGAIEMARDAEGD